jgi:hypothetical protein
VPGRGDEQAVSPVHRVTSEIVLSFEVVLSGDDGFLPAPGCAIVVQAYCLPAGQEASDARNQVLRQCEDVQATADVYGHASVILPAGTTHVSYSVEHERRHWGRGHWREGEATAIRVVLQRCAALTALVRGPMPRRAMLHVAGVEIGQRLRVPAEGARTDVPFVPVAWSPVQVLLRQADGVEHVVREPVELVHGARVEVVFDTTEAMGSLRGSLVDERGDAVANVSVFVAPQRAVSGFSHAEMSTANDGSFVFSGLPATQHRISISSPKHAPWLGAIDLRAEPNADLGRIVLRSGVTVTGSVAAGFRERVRFAGALPMSEAGWGLEANVLSGRRVSIDERGRFAIDRLSTGTHLVWVATGSGERDASWSGRIVEVGDAASGQRTVEVGEVALPSESRWSGVLRPVGGAAWPEGGRCLAMGIEEPWWSTSALAADGGVTMELGRGDWCLGFAVAGRWRWLRVMPASGAPTEVLEPSGSATIVSEAVVPEDLLVELEFVPTSSSPDSAARGWRSGVTRHGIEGHACTLRGLAAGAYRLHAYRDRVVLPPLEFTLSEGESMWLPWPIDWR